MLYYSLRSILPSHSSRQTNHHANPEPQTHPQAPSKSYYAALDRFARLGVTHGNRCARRLPDPPRNTVPASAAGPSCRSSRSTARRGNRRIVVDGALIDDFQLAHGYWEAKDIDDDLPAEVERKFEAGYPRDNILFQTPQRAILWQNERLALDADLTERGPADRDAPDLLRLPPAGVRRLGGGSRPVQRQSGRHRRTAWQQLIQE